MVFVLIKQILPSATSAQRPLPSLQPDTANLSHLWSVGGVRGKISFDHWWGTSAWVEIIISPAIKFPIMEQKGNLINPPVAHTMAEPWAPKPFTNPSDLPNWATPCAPPTCGPPLFTGRGFPHGMRLLRVSHGLWLVRYPAPAAITATATDALSWPKTLCSQLQSEKQQQCTVFNTVCHGKWREDKQTLFYNTKNVTPFAKT